MKENFFFEVNAGAARGFSKEDRRDLGHWAATASSASAAADEDSDEETDPPPAHFVPARRGRGRAGHVSRGSASARDDMDLVYSRGEGRLGEETSQLAVRGRLSRIFRLAYAARAAGESFRDYRDRLQEYLACKTDKSGSSVADYLDGMDLGGPHPPASSRIRQHDPSCYW